jgi:hypothetical protein
MKNARYRFLGHSCCVRAVSLVLTCPHTHTHPSTLPSFRVTATQASILGPGPRNNSVAQQLYDIQQVLDSDDLAEVRFRLLYRRFCNDDEDELKPEVLTKLIEVCKRQGLCHMRSSFAPPLPSNAICPLASSDSPPMCVERFAQLSPGKDGYLHKCAALLNEALRVAEEDHKVLLPDEMLADTITRLFANVCVPWRVGLRAAHPFSLSSRPNAPV